MVPRMGRTPRRRPRPFGRRQRSNRDAQTVISEDRALRIARGHACENCGEYSYKRLTVKLATDKDRTELGETWHAFKTCGVCGMEHEMGIDAEGEIVYVS